MFTRNALMTACGSLIGLGIVVAATVGLSASVRSNRIEYVTFSGPVGLPGVALGTGTYTFEVANAEASADIIRVRSRATNQVVFLGFTKAAERPRGLAENRSVVLGESRAGVAAPILAWYPTGEQMGHQFLWRSHGR